MSNIATNIEQSKHLLELGLSKETADMSYSEEYFGKDNDGNDEWCWRLNACRFIDVEGIIPAWSLSALLEVMKEHCPELLFLEAYWYCRCMQVESEYCDDPITAVYDVLCWLLEQWLIEKGGNDESDVH